ncbi:MAG: DUF3267 domain-containing protein [Oscillospiraceae bacterium]|nr:DUF3267 domain-containing protein [Oscillospiraceae bacterium]
MKEKRILSKAEQNRLEHFQSIVREMEAQGYARHDLTINMKKANLFAILLLIPLFIIGYGAYYYVNRLVGFGGFNIWFFVVGYIVLIVVHELIHGLSWSIFTPHHFKDIEFGVMRPSYNPYCTCLVPLKKMQYLIGAVMPLIPLGILPMILGIAVKNTNILFLGIVMTDAAAGDMLIIRRLLSYKSKAGEITYMDHPTEAGGVVLER